MIEIPQFMLEYFRLVMYGLGMLSAGFSYVIQKQSRLILIGNISLGTVGILSLFHIMYFNMRPELLFTAGIFFWALFNFLNFLSVGLKKNGC